MASNDVAPSQMGEVSRWIDGTEMPPAVKVMMNILLNEATMDDSGNTAVWDIMEQILRAEGADAVFAAANKGATSGKDFVGKPFYLDGADIRWKVSNVSLSKAASDPMVFPFYALLDITNMETGDVMPLTCGGVTFCTVLYRLKSAGYFDTPEYAEGQPFVIRAKPAGMGEVLIPEKYVMPKMASQRAAKPADATSK